MGITIATFTRYAPGILGEAPTLANLQALTAAQAGQIYKPQYWDVLLGDQINDQLSAEMIADFGVNAGINRAVITAQSILVNMGFSQVNVDGSFGPISLTALNSADAASFYNSYKQARIAYYTQLAQDNPKLEGFLNGWVNRVNSFPDWTANQA